jgi:hypothetical protein
MVESFKSKHLGPQLELLLQAAFEGVISYPWEVYDPAIIYEPLRKVTFQGGSYIKTAESAAGVVPTNTGYWLPIALPGRGVEFYVSDTHIQWRYAGDPEWTNLIALSELQGEPGPVGPQGAPGPTTITIGTVTTAPPGTPASVTNSGTSEDVILDFTIPRGADGAGSGDMQKSVYDTDDDGKVDAAEVADAVPWTGVADKPASYTPASHTHGDVTNDGKIGTTANKAVYTGTGGSLQAGTLPVAAGGTGAATASAALSALGGVPLTGGTMTGALVAQSNTNYTTAQMRNVILSTASPSGGNNGDIWIKYT